MGVDRIHLLCRGLAAAMPVVIMATPVGAMQDAPPEIVIRGGTIYPGGASPFRGDVAIRGDRIIYVGPRAPKGAKRVIDAKGLIVAPGFIDPHTHVGDALSSSDPAARLVVPFLTQGVTTAFIGVDGGGDPDIARTFRGEGAEGGGMLDASGRDFGINFASYVGLGSVRAKVMGAADRAPTAAELGKMKALVADAMCKGALGLSTGLFYAPQSFAKRDEVVALAQVAADNGGVYDSHLRDESTYTIGLSGAVDEAIEIGRRTGIPIHIAHIKALGVDVQGQAPAIIEKVEAAQRDGLTVHADQYPWSASGTALSAALMPRWAQDGGRTAMLRRLEDPAQLKRIRPEMAENLRRRGGAKSILITSGPKAAEGRTLEQIANGGDPIDAAIAILRQQESGVASFNQSEADIAAFMRRPWVVTSSDASGGHPRYYASFARKYATYVRERQVIDLRAFIDRSTVVTAGMFALPGRGQLKPGAFADVIAFDPKAFGPRADYAHPTLMSRGMRTVIVNGQVALEDGAVTGAAAGRPLARAPAKGDCR